MVPPIQMRLALMAVLALGATSTAVAQGLFFRGFAAAPLGNASLQVVPTPSGPVLRLSHVQTQSATDGVSLNVQSLGSLRIELSSGNSYASGAQLTFGPRGRFGTAANAPLGPVRLNRNAQGWAMVSDHAVLGASTCDVQLYRGTVLVRELLGQPVATAVGWSSANPASLEWFCGNDPCRIIPDWGWGPWPPWGPYELVEELRLTQEALTTVGAGAAVLADRIVVATRQLPQVVESLTFVNLLIPGQATLDIADLGFGAFGTALKTRGAARVNSASCQGPSGRCLQISNIGSSGQDGVVVNYGRAQNAGVAVDVGTGTVYPGAYVEWQYEGRDENDVPRNVGSFVASRTAVGWRITTDLSGLASSLVRVEGFINSQPSMAIVEIPPGDIIVDFPWPNPPQPEPPPCVDPHYMIARPAPTDPGPAPLAGSERDPCVLHALLAPIPVTIQAGGQTIPATCDLIRITAVNPAADLAWISKATLRTAGMPPLSILQMPFRSASGMHLPSAAGTAAADLLHVNNSTGGPARRVDVLVGEPIVLRLDAPAGTAAPAFWVLAHPGTPDPGDVTALPPVGDLSFPIGLILASSFSGSLIPLPLAFAPLNLVFQHPGVPLGLELSLQAVVQDASAPSGFSISNGVMAKLF